MFVINNYLLSFIVINNYYLFMISLDECSASSNAADKLYRKILVPSKTEEDVNA